MKRLHPLGIARVFAASLASVTSLASLASLASRVLLVAIPLASAFVGTPWALAQASLTVGDEIIVGGGPAAPPKVIQTGFQLHVDLHGQSTIIQRSPNGDGSFHQVMMTVPTDAIQSGTTAQVGASTSSSSESSKAPFSIRDMSGTSIESLSATLSVSDPAQRASAARALGRAGSDQDKQDAAHALALTLSDADPRVVREAAAALGHLGDHGAVPDLVNLVYNADDQTSVAAIQALAAIGDRSVIPDLTKLARREDGPVATAAAAALACMAKAASARASTRASPAPATAPAVAPQRPSPPPH